MISIGQETVTNLLAKPCAFFTKNEENFEKFQEICEIFGSKSLLKIEFFSQFSTKYFLEFCLFSEGISEGTSGR